MNLPGEHGDMPSAHAQKTCAAQVQDDPGLEAEAAEVVYDWNLQTDAISWGPNFRAIVGLDDCEAVATGLGYAEHLAPESPTSRYEAIMAPGGVDTGGGVPFKVVYGLLPAKRSKAAPIWIEDCGRWFADATDRPGRVHGVVRVVTKEFEADRRLAASAQRDPATGAFTRAHFIEHLARQLSLAARKTSTFAVLLVGLEQADGSAPDDPTMARVVESLRSQMRAHELLARHSGNKLAALLEGCDAAQAEAAAERFVEAIAAGEGPAVQPRVGAVIAPLHGRTPQALLQFAEEALEVARQPTSPWFVRFDAEQRARAQAAPLAQASDEILSALNDRRVVLALQPVVAAKTQAIAFYEGLVRIRRSNGTLIFPEALVPDAERQGLVPLIDRRVIELAFALLTADRKLVLSINASVTSLHDPSWLDHLRTCCRLRPDAARRLTVEITETCVIADLEATRAILTAIKPLGVRIAIDDFGSGHSSFRNLRQLPIDYLKIDGAFSQNLATSQDDRFFIRALIDLARNLQIPTVAEWVEDAETARILADWGVDYLQGHFFGKAEVTPEVAPRRTAG